MHSMIYQRRWLAMAVIAAVNIGLGCWVRGVTADDFTTVHPVTGQAGATDDACDGVGKRPCAYVARLQCSENSCCECGCSHGCHRVCRLVAEEKEVTVTCYGVGSEDFCVSGPSVPLCQYCETICGDCDCDSKIAAKPQRFTWMQWRPSTTATIFTRKKLMKKEIKKKIPTYKWVVDDLCEECQQAAAKMEVDKTAVLPAPPADYSPLFY